MTTRIVEFRMPPAREIAQQCDTARRSLTELMWALDDAYQQQDADELVFDAGDVRNWVRDTLRPAIAATALAQLMLGGAES